MIREFETSTGYVKVNLNSIINAEVSDNNTLLEMQDSTSIRALKTNKEEMISLLSEFCSCTITEIEQSKT